MTDWDFIKKIEPDEKQIEENIEKKPEQELIIDEDTVYEIDLDCMKRRKLK